MKIVKFVKILKLTELFRNKVVMVTGGTGSFGNAIIPELLKLPIKEVIVFSRDEEKQLDMERKIVDPRLTFEVGNIRDYKKVLESLHADFIYHAAALKIISTCEHYPEEAFKTNVLGTVNVKKACVHNNVKKAILISTDKAVKPVNTYGMTKALAERIWLHQLPSTCSFSVVRYGNVIGSRGSIIPFFKDLMKQKKPLPITDKNMTRFLISLEHAIRFVFYATANMTGCEIYVPNLPACKITCLVKAIGEKHPFKIVGVRAGEKIAEILISEEEMRRTKKIINHFIIYPHGKYTSGIIKKEFSSENAQQLTLSEIRKLVKEVNP